MRFNNFHIFIIAALIPPFAKSNNWAHSDLLYFNYFFIPAYGSYFPISLQSFFFFHLKLDILNNIFKKF